MKKTLNIALSALLCVALAVLILTFSIGLPIYIRPFYYLQIESLGLPARTGHTPEEIRAAYAEMMDYLTLPGREFGTGVFVFTESGAAHFKDCRVLFSLNFWGLVISAAVTAICLILHRRRVVALSPYTPLLAGALPLALCLGLGVACAIDFVSVFQAFHAVFFPGKSNWMFDARENEIIRALPREFFLRCAILIGISLLLLSVGLMLYGVLKEKSKK